MARLAFFTRRSGPDAAAGGADLTGRSSAAAAALAVVLACTFLSLALWAVLMLSPRVPWADTWLFDSQLLGQPFPRNVLQVDNGHAQLPSRLLRWSELRFAAGNPWPTILAGLGFLLLSLMLWCRAAGALTTPGKRPLQDPLRLAWCLLGILGLCWLGNWRILAHANESLHAWLVVACLFGALNLVSREHPSTPRVVFALLLAVLASLAFGTGPAVFAALAAVFWMQAAPGRRWLLFGFALLLTGLVYLALPNSHASAGVLAIHPLLQFDQLARWLGSPWLLAGGPFTDAALLPRMPSTLRPLAAPSALALEALFGPAATSRWPQFGFGLVGIACLLLLSVGQRRRRGTDPHRSLALGTAWFALAAGALVMLARSDYFLNHPEQIHAARYAPWYTLFWVGLGAAGLAGERAARHAAGMLRLVVVLAFVLLPSSTWNGFRAVNMSRIAQADALALRFGIFDPAATHGENRLEELRRAAPLLAGIGAPPFSVSERHFAPGTGIPVQVTDSTPIDNALPGPAHRLRFQLDQPGRGTVFLLDADGRAVGYAMRRLGARDWEGLVDTDATDLRAIPLP